MGEWDLYPTGTPAASDTLLYRDISATPPAPGTVKQSTVTDLLAGVAANPMTTAGDTIYGGTSGAQTRLAGNTAANRKFLRQLGTGSASAAPAWDVLQAGDIPSPAGLFNVALYGATGNGSTDDTAAIASAVTAWATAENGVLFFPAGIYKISESGVITMNFPGQGILGLGRSASVLAPTSAVTGDVIRWQMNPFTTAPAGTIQGLGIDGTSAGSGARGLHVGDVIGHVLRDFRSDNFSSGLGIYVDNVTHWTEEMAWESVFAENNLNCVTFDAGNGGTNSWDYNQMQLRVNLFDGQTGVTFQNGGTWQGGVSEVKGNNQGGTVVAVKDTCSVQGQFFWTCDGDGDSPVGLNMSSGGNLGGTGYIDFSSGGMTNVNAGSFNVQLFGWANLPGIGTALPGALTYVPQFAGGMTLGSTPFFCGGFDPTFASAAGSFFFRTDTPTVANQRIYINTDGTGGGWTGLV